MKRNEILGEHKKGVKAVKHNKKPKDHSAEYGKAKEKLAPVKPMEGYNPNSVGAQHRRSLDQSHAADLKARAESPDATERDHQRYQSYLDKKEQMRNDYNDRMERESVAQEGRWDRRDAYQRDYDSSQRGMGRRDFGYDDAGYSLAPGHDEGEPVYSRAHDRIGHGGPTARREPAADVPHDVYIDGRKWKTFGSASHASNVARKLQANGKSVSVKASPTDEAMGAEVGKITKVDPTTKKATLTKADGSSMEVDSTALKPTPDGKMSMDTPDTDELKAGTAVVSTENVELRRLRELTGQPALPVEEGDDELATRRIVPGQETPPGINRLTGKPIEEPPVSSTPAPAGPTLSSRYGPDYEGAPAAYTITVKGKDYKFAGRDKTGPGTGSIIKVPGGAVGIRGLAPVSVEVSDDGMYYLAPATNESTDNELLQKMLSIAGLR